MYDVYIILLRQKCVLGPGRVIYMYGKAQRINLRRDLVTSASWCPGPRAATAPILLPADFVCELMSTGRMARFPCTNLNVEGFYEHKHLLRAVEKQPGSEDCALGVAIRIYNIVNRCTS